MSGDWWLEGVPTRGASGDFAGAGKAPLARRSPRLEFLATGAVAPGHADTGAAFAVIVGHPSPLPFGRGEGESSADFRRTGVHREGEIAGRFMAKQGSWGASTSNVGRASGPQTD